MRDNGHDGTPGVVDVLVLHEDEVVRDSYCTALRRHGCQVHKAANGGEALRLLQNRSFDVLVTNVADVKDENVQFLEETLRIRPWLGIVIVSAGVGDAVLPRIYELGCTCVLERPVSMSTLCENVVNEARARKELEALRYGFIANTPPQKTVVLGGDMGQDNDVIQYNFLTIAHL